MQGDERFKKKVNLICGCGVGEGGVSTNNFSLSFGRTSARIVCFFVMIFDNNNPFSCKINGLFTLILQNPIHLENVAIVSCFIWKTSVLV